MKNTLMKWVNLDQLAEEARLNPLTAAEVMVVGRKEGGMTGYGGNLLIYEQLTQRMPKWVNGS